MINSQGRNFQVLYKILPGFTPPVEAHSDSGNPQRSMVTQANGMPQSSNNTKLDGATISHPWLPRLVAYLPPVEAVETVNVVSNSFDAEQGMAGGAAMNVTIKSGTNAFHGAGWEFMTNSVLKARNYFYCLYSCTGDPNRAPKNVQNQFGGMFGGPISKNKLFFFADWERTTRRLAASALRTVPPARCAPAISTAPAPPSSTRRPATPMARAAPRFPNNTIPTRPHRSRRPSYMANLIPQPNQSVFPEQLPGHRRLRVPARQHRYQDHLQSQPTSCRSSAATASRPLWSLTRLPLARPVAMPPTAVSRAARPGAIQSTGIGATYTISPHVLLRWRHSATHACASAPQNIDIDKNYGTGRTEDSRHQRHRSAAGRAIRVSPSTRFRTSATRTSRIRSCSATTSTSPAAT